MKLSNGIISAEIKNHGAELVSAVKGQREYMWCADAKYWARISPVLFPIVGGLNNKQYRTDGSSYSLGQHGFARDMEFDVVSAENSTAKFVLKSNDETLKKYPFDFELYITYTLIDSSIRIDWEVVNTGKKEMYFSIGAHPAFNLKDGKNYFIFDTDKDIIYSNINSEGLYIDGKTNSLTNNGCVEITTDMFDNDALIIENSQAKQVKLCDENMDAYVSVTFDAPLVGLWSPVGKNAPFVCIEPWYGRCDKEGFNEDFSKKDYIIKLDTGNNFKAGYTIELI